VAIVFVRETDYEYTRLKKNIFEIISALDNDVIKSGNRVLIKPNFLEPAMIDQAITTHPLIIKIVSEYVLDKGGRVIISDSPGRGKLKKTMKECGVLDVINGMDVEIRDFIESKEIYVDSNIKKIEIAKDVFEADVIINLPKLKTHSQMMLTLAVKNLFGCVIGLKKTRVAKKLKFDYDKCIRCYCCLEVCPHSAINIEEPSLRRLISYVGSKLIG
jgi:uncharacterized protein (DUF362 family)